MRYNKIRTMDVSNGPGIRVSLFTQGCAIKCKGCFNSELWDYSGGKIFTDETINHILDLCDNPHIEGLSLLGGEPLSLVNLVELKKLIIRFNERFPDKNIWLWTGYYYDQLIEQQKEIVNLCDVLVEGPFDIDKKDPNLLYRGSSNQIITKIK